MYPELFFRINLSHILSKKAQHVLVQALWGTLSANGKHFTDTVTVSWDVQQQGSEWVNLPQQPGLLALPA